MDYARLVAELESARARSVLLMPRTLPFAPPPAPPQASAVPPAPSRPQGGGPRGRQAPGAAPRAGGASSISASASAGSRARAAGGPGSEAGVGGAGRGTDLSAAMPPSSGVWDEEESWLDPAAYLQALQREVAFRVAAPAPLRQISPHNLDAAVAARMYRPPAPAPTSAPAGPNRSASSPTSAAMGRAVGAGGGVRGGRGGTEGGAADQRLVAVLTAAALAAAAEHRQAGDAGGGAVVPTRAKKRVRVAFGRRMPAQGPSPPEHKQHGLAKPAL